MTPDPTNPKQFIAIGYEPHATAGQRPLQLVDSAGEVVDKPRIDLLREAYFDDDLKLKLKPSEIAEVEADLRSKLTAEHVHVPEPAKGKTAGSQTTKPVKVKEKPFAATANCGKVMKGVTQKQVDNFAKRLFGPRMCVTGVIEQKDLSGLDIHAASQRGIVPDLYHTNRPSPIVQDLAAAGHLGAKTGTGFYDWREVDLAAHRRKAADKLARLLALLEGD